MPAMDINYHNLCNQHLRLTDRQWPNIDGCVENWAGHSLLPYATRGCIHTWTNLRQMPDLPYIGSGTPDSDPFSTCVGVSQPRTWVRVSTRTSQLGTRQKRSSWIGVRNSFRERWSRQNDLTASSWWFREEGSSSLNTNLVRGMTGIWNICTNTL